MAAIARFAVDLETTILAGSFEQAILEPYSFAQLGAVVLTFS